MSHRQQQLSHALFCGIQGADTSAVENALSEIEGQILDANRITGLQAKMLTDVVEMFQKGFNDKQPVDTPYHDLEHTLQTTLCFAQICLNWKHSGKEPRIGHEDFQNGLAAALLHDVGYMKDAHDPDGSGAKHTFGHELRSCEIASAYLSHLGWNTTRIETVCAIIRCTGPLADFATIEFANPMALCLGQMVCTADYLGQIADPGYVGKIPALYLEFKESYQVRSIPVENRNYGSLDDLLQGTDTFWNTVVQPRLRDECDAVCDLLTDRETGANAYLAQVEVNLKRIDELNSTASN